MAVTDPTQRAALQAIGVNPDLVTISMTSFNSASGQLSANTGVGYLKNPFQTPMQLVLTGTIATGSTKTNFFLDDAVGLAGSFSQVGTDTGIAFVPQTITAAVLKDYLKTVALVMGGYNFESSDPNMLSNNLRAIYTTLDGNVSSKQMFSAQTVSNMQQNPNLLNVDQSFVYTNDCALKINVTAPASGSTIYTFTFKVKGAVPYGELNQFLAEAKIVERSKMSC